MILLKIFGFLILWAACAAMVDLLLAAFVGGLFTFANLALQVPLSFGPPPEGWDLVPLALIGVLPGLLWAAGAVSKAGEG